MDIDKRIYAGNRAREVLENEVYQQVFKNIESEIIEEWKQSPARSEGDREKLWNLLKLLGKLQATLQTTFETGKLARLDLDHQNSLAKRAKEWIGME